MHAIFKIEVYKSIVKVFPMSCVGIKYNVAVLLGNRV